MGLHFERLQEQDVLQLCEISDEFSDIDLEGVIPFLAEKQNIAFVAKLDNKVIGLLFGYSLTDFDGGTAQLFIYSVDIHTEYQDEGYGSQFVQYVISWAKEIGFRQCFVCADTDNKRAYRVYEKIGMDVVATNEFTMQFFCDE